MWPPHPLEQQQQTTTTAATTATPFGSVWRWLGTPALALAGVEGAGLAPVCLARRRALDQASNKLCRRRRRGRAALEVLQAGGRAERASRSATRAAAAARRKHWRSSQRRLGTTAGLLPVVVVVVAVAAVRACFLFSLRQAGANNTEARARKRADGQADGALALRTINRRLPARLL